MMSAAHENILSDLRQVHADMASRISELASVLEDELTKYNTFDILANISFAEHVVDPERYEERTHEGLSAHAEYLAMLALKRPFHEGGPELIDGPEIAEVQHLVRDAIQATSIYYATESAGADPPRSPDAIDELRRSAIVHNLIVRTPGYEHHLCETLEALFSAEPIANWLVDALGFSLSDALTLNRAVQQVIADRLHKRSEQAKEYGRTLRQAVRLAQRGKLLPDGVPPDLVRDLADRKEKKMLRALRNLEIALIFTRLGETISFSASELAGAAGLSTEVADTYLHTRSLDFGSVDTSFIRPTPTPPLQQRPFLHHAARYLAPAPVWMMWGLRLFLEDNLNPDKPGGINRDMSLWRVYDRHRAKFLETASLSYLEGALQHAMVHRRLHYRCMVNDKEEDCELDGLIDFDTALFLVECKAGSIGPPARRGDTARLRVDLRKLLTEAHGQGIRAKEYIETAEAPEFTTDTGDTIVIEPERYRYIFVVTVTLDDTAPFSSVLHELVPLGIYPAGQLPWAVSLLDLRVITDLMQFPCQLVDFLVRRSRVNELARIGTSDELDLFGHYLAQGLYFEDLPDDVQLRLLSFTTNFDNYYLYQQGVRATPAEKPSQAMPEIMAGLVGEMEAAHPENYLLGALALLGMNSDTRRQFQRWFARSLERARLDGGYHDFTFVWKKHKSIGLTTMVSGDGDVEELSKRLHVYCTIKKYEQQCDQWVGIGCVAGESGLFHVYQPLDTPWVPDSEMDETLALWRGYLHGK